MEINCTSDSIETALAAIGPKQILIQPKSKQIAPNRIKSC
jgi:hypothetical protein